MSTMDRTGKIFAVTHYNVRCGLCEKVETLDCDSSRQAPQEARCFGWKLTKMDGWVCPDCLPEKSP